MPASLTPEPVWKGIPYSDLSGKLDIHNVYVSQALSRASKLKPGIERFAYMVFGPNFIGSLAFALDPWSEYRFPTMPITPTNRTRKLSCISGQARGYKLYTSRRDCDKIPDVSTPDLQDFIGPFCSTSYIPGGTQPELAQVHITGVRSDTTVRTRPIGSKGGEFELFVPKLEAPARKGSDLQHDTYYFLPGVPKYEQYFEDWITRGEIGYGPAFRVAQADIDLLLTGERARFVQLRDKYAFGMVRDCVPTNRKISISRNVGELKDLPLLLRQTTKYFCNPIQQLSTLKGEGSQYLNLKFGWEATFKSVVDMLKVPEQIAKEVNYLIERNGQSTSFRSKRKGVDVTPSIPAVTYTAYPRETTISNGSLSRNKWELRMLLNYTLKFPKIDVPKLREDLLNQKWGAWPNPTDVYNLTPWTWLVDWFSGLGEYVDVMNTLAEDKNLFNYGFLTYVSEGEVAYTRKVQRSNVTTWKAEPPIQTANHTDLVFKTSGGSISYKYQKRIDISNIDDVSVISRPTTLSVDQLAITGALLTKFAKS